MARRTLLQSEAKEIELGPTSARCAPPFQTLHTMYSSELLEILIQSPTSEADISFFAHGMPDMWLTAENEMTLPD